MVRNRIYVNFEIFPSAIFVILILTFETLSLIEVPHWFLVSGMEEIPQVWECQTPRTWALIA